MLTRIKSSLIPIIDRGWFGLQPLNTHIAICGCPRSGTSRMLHILEACVEDAHTFGREVGAIKAATTALRNNRYMVSKLPRDIFVFDDIRALYSSRDADGEVRRHAPRSARNPDVDPSETTGPVLRRYRTLA